MRSDMDMIGAIAAIKRLYKLADCMTPAENNAALRAIAFLEGGATERSLAELTGRVIEDDGVTEVSVSDLVELGLWRGPNDNVGASLPSEGGSDACPAATGIRSGALFQAGIAALRWSPRPKGNGTEASNLAEAYERLADELFWDSIACPGMLRFREFAEIDSERMALRYDDSAVVIVTADWGGAPDGKSVATRVEVIRC